MGPFRLLEHTADMGIEATGADLEELFTAAADGLRAILCDAPPGPCSLWQPLEVTAPEIEELLVNWLGAILYRLETEGLFPERFQVKAISPTHLRASIGGRHLDGESPPPDREIKAVTWHQLQVRQQAGRWRARVYVDL